MRQRRESAIYVIAVGAGEGPLTEAKAVVLRGPVGTTLRALEAAIPTRREDWWGK